jgi:hypothetical protein
MCTIAAGYTQQDDLITAEIGLFAVLEFIAAAIASALTNDHSVAKFLRPLVLQIVPAFATQGDLKVLRT